MSLAIFVYDFSTKTDRMRRSYMSTKYLQCKANFAKEKHFLRGFHKKCFILCQKWLFVAKQLRDFVSLSLHAVQDY